MHTAIRSFIHRITSLCFLLHSHLIHIRCSPHRLIKLSSPISGYPVLSSIPQCPYHFNPFPLSGIPPPTNWISSRLISSSIRNFISHFPYHILAFSLLQNSVPLSNNHSTEQPKDELRGIISARVWILYYPFLNSSASLPLPRLRYTSLLDVGYKRGEGHWVCWRARFWCGSLWFW